MGREEEGEEEEEKKKAMDKLNSLVSCQLFKDKER